MGQGKPFTELLINQPLLSRANRNYEERVMTGLGNQQVEKVFSQ